MARFFRRGSRDVRLTRHGGAGSNIGVIYWDNNATTPIADEVFAAMEPYLRDCFMNPSADYVSARAVRRAIEEAREHVARLAGASAGEIVFTSGATEAINTVLRGMARMGTAGSASHMMCVATDHDASLHTLRQLGREGVVLPAECPVDRQGVVDCDAWARFVREEDVAGVSLTWVNNETGVVQDVASLCACAHEAGVPVHVDGVQALGKIPVDLHGVGVDYASFSAHKMHGPKGVGALYVKSGCRMPVLLFGGGQEDDRRSGTENVAGIVGFGAAAELAARQLDEAACRMRRLRDAFEGRLQAALDGVEIQSAGSERVSNTSNISFAGCTAQALMLLLEPLGMLCSAGSACSTANPHASHVLTAMGLSDAEARSCLRFSISSMTTEDEMEHASGLVIEAVRKVRSVQSSKTGPVMVFRP